MTVRMRQYVERDIIAALVTQVLEAGHDISVNDGGETTLWNSRDKAAIMAALMTTDEDHLYVDARRGPLDEVLGVRGEVALIYGNGPCVINDYHVSLEPLMTRAEALADYWDSDGEWQERPA